MRIETTTAFILVAFLLVGHQGHVNPFETSNDSEKGILTKDTSYLNIGGALRFNAFYKNWDGQENNQNKGGDFDIDTWLMNANGSHNGILISAEYRFYPGFNFLHHGWIGYEFPSKTSVKLGLSQVPFGLLPYASSSWFLSMGYYLGFEDDYDVGVRIDQEMGDWTFNAAFYKNSEGSYTGSSDASARYSYDVVGKNEEINQLNGRVVRQLGHFEIGASGQWGQLYQSELKQSGEHYAFALHGRAKFGKLRLKAQAFKFTFDPVQLPSEENKLVIMGAYDFPYEVAKRGTIVSGGFNYKVPVGLGPLNTITFYTDYAYFDKAYETFEDAQMVVGGIMFSAGPVVSYLDVANGNNHPWVGPVWTEALSRGKAPSNELQEPDTKWATRVNLNIGYYF